MKKWFVKYFVSKLTDEKVLKELFIIIARRIVKATKTKTDDEILEKFIKAVE